ncbi:hypothetical protein B7P43_G13270 [Cryptotermes secundus]|uniref:Uncharacterized protein n=1 Tax=Cryptotermes secundus TaxID=105785 RepID=A0A2J7Q5N7_9NEOP|nr:hypothetical protein B7P43_G13270 [Cryptotermes secundus]
MEWKQPMWSVKKKFGIQPSAGEMILPLYLECIRDKFGTLPRERHNRTQCPL